MAHSVLLVPVPELDSVVRPRLLRGSPELLTEAEDAVTAHVTLLGPFADLDAIDDGLLSELRSFFADVTPFTFRLTEICRFPNGPTYLAPDPARPFRQLTHELSRRFPEYPPYGGEFDDVVPHLTVPVPDSEDPQALGLQLEPRLPITAHAREAALWWYEPHRCRTLETFPFGTAAA
jgi:hypothetical protein